MINPSSSGLQFSAPAVKTISSGSFPELLRVGSLVLREDGLHFYFSVISRYTETPMSVCGWGKKKESWISGDSLGIIP